MKVCKVYPEYEVSKIFFLLIDMVFKAGQTSKTKDLTDNLIYQVNTLLS